MCTTNWSSVTSMIHELTKMVTVDNVWHTQEGHWTYSYRDRDAVVFYQCPPGYCRCDRLGNISDDTACYAVLPNDDSDGQCVCDRKGIVTSSPCHTIIIV